MSYRNSDGSITLRNLGMTKATFQHIEDSVVCEDGSYCFVEETLKEADPEKRDALYQKLIVEEYFETMDPLYRWTYRGKEKDACDFILLQDCNVSKEAFEKMEGFVCDYCTEDVLVDKSIEDDEERDDCYIGTVVEEYIREQALSADLRFADGNFDLFEVILARYDLV